jgi:hypothetical protein
MTPVSSGLPSPPRPIAPTFLALLVAGCGTELLGASETRTDTWTQVSTDEVDILFVIDDSSSMAEEQARLTDGFDAFADELEAAASDFHLGVTGTTLSGYGDDLQAPLVGDPPFLTDADRGLRSAFESRALLGMSGSDREQGLAAALLALDPAAGGPNEGFLRAASQLVIVFVSDEDDCTDDGALQGQPATACYEPASPLVPVTKWMSELAEAAGPLERIRIAALVPPPEPTCDGAYPGTRYRQAAAMSGGAAGDPCREDWSEMLGSLGRLAAGVRTRFQLSRAAQPETLMVQVDGEDVPPGSSWHYEVDAWTVVFDRDAVPARGATVSATYTVDPGRSVPQGSAPYGSTE